MRSPAWPKWKEAMEEEHAALEVHRTWCLEKPPPGTNVIGCRWVFIVKCDANGAPIRYRARLVTQGFSHTAHRHKFYSPENSLKFIV